ncbi:MAG: S46 family peptidase [Bacteroidaceae bacterium]|nr:S46 family peptidase [Bacteroidaceae bacterium]
MNHDHEYYPDANFTLRLSYGLCKPIDPTLLAQAKAKQKGQNGMLQQTSLDAASLVAESDQLYTTPASFLNKHDKNPTERDFAVIPPVLQWMRSGHHSQRYLDPATGQLPLCFLTTNDITGGNSGSGMYDGKGRLIGLAFDGNWEAMSGDIKFDDNLQRCIGVDIRWVLSVIDDYSHASRLIEELTIE